MKATERLRRIMTHNDNGNEGAVYAALEDAIENATTDAERGLFVGAKRAFSACATNMEAAEIFDALNQTAIGLETPMRAIDKGTALHQHLEELGELREFEGTLREAVGREAIGSDGEPVSLVELAGIFRGLLGDPS